MSKTAATAEQLAAFLASGRTVTKCPLAQGNATPLRVLRKLADAALDELNYVRSRRRY